MDDWILRPEKVSSIVKHSLSARKGIRARGNDRSPSGEAAFLAETSLSAWRRLLARIRQRAPGITGPTPFATGWWRSWSTISDSPNSAIPDPTGRGDKNDVAFALCNFSEYLLQAGDAKKIRELARHVVALLGGNGLDRKLAELVEDFTPYPACGR